MLNQDPENQLIHLRKYAQSRGLVVRGELVDRGISGSRERRPALDDLLQRARNREFQIVVVSALDRLGRNTKHMLNLIDELKDYGVTIVSLREGIDFSSAMGQLMLTVISAISQLERSLISERIKNALAAKKLAAQESGSGWRCGRPQIVDGRIRKQVMDLRSQGKSIRAIAKEVGIGKTSVLRIINSGPKE